MDAMLTIINNINKLLNVSLILPNIYDTNIIIEGMYRLTPNKNKIIKSIEIKLDFGYGPIPTKSSHLIISGFQKKHYYKINYEDLKQFTPIVDKLLWKNMAFVPPRISSSELVLPYTQYESKRHAPVTGPNPHATPQP